MPHLNKIFIVGHLGRDPELRSTATGKAVANFSVAVTEKRGDKEETVWFRCTSWEKQAEFAGKYLTKGRAVLVEGRITTEKYKNKEGKEVDTWGVTVERLQAMDSNRPKADTAPIGQTEGMIPESELPF